MDTKFEKHLLDIRRNNSPEYSEDLLQYMEKVYVSFGIHMSPYFLAGCSLSEENIKIKINESIRKQHRLQFHNVGHNAWLRYFSIDNHYPWLQLEQYLIQHMYAIQKSESNIGNKRLAIGLGWLSKDETDAETIQKASRKVTDALNIIKNVRKTFVIIQKYKYGQKGSWHLIKANWLEIMNLYQSYNLKSGQSIRFRKSIKYRIISLVSRFSKKFSNALAELMRKQRRYLEGLHSFNLEEFQDLKNSLVYVFKDYWDIDIPDSKKGSLIPNYFTEDNTLILEIRDRIIYEELEYAYMTSTFKSKWGINLKLVANF